MGAEMVGPLVGWEILPQRGLRLLSAARRTPSQRMAERQKPLSQHLASRYISRAFAILSKARRDPAHDEVVDDEQYVWRQCPMLYY
jgi:hypothetical protein